MTKLRNAQAELKVGVESDTLSKKFSIEARASLHQRNDHLDLWIRKISINLTSWLILGDLWGPNIIEMPRRRSKTSSHSWKGTTTMQWQSRSDMAIFLKRS